jgi:hypothetical protein
LAQVATRHDPHNKTIKIIMSFGVHVLEGKSDAFSNKKERRSTCSLQLTNSLKRIFKTPRK